MHDRVDNVGQGSPTGAAKPTGRHAVEAMQCVMRRCQDMHREAAMRHFQTQA